MGFNAIVEIIYDVLHYRPFELNQTRITPSSIETCNVVIVIFFLISKVLRTTILDGILGRFQIDQGTKYNLNRVIHYQYI